MVFGCNPASRATPTGNASGTSRKASAGGGTASGGSSPGIAAMGGSAGRGQSLRRRQNRARGVDHCLLLRRQRRVLSLRGGDLTQQILPLRLQFCAYRGGLLGRGAGVGGRLLRGRDGGGRTLACCLEGLHLIGRLGDDYPLQRQLIDEPLRGGCGQHRGELAGASTHVGHRRDAVDRGLKGLELGVRGVKCRQVGAMALLGGCLIHQSRVSIALCGRDVAASLHRLRGTTRRAWSVRQPPGPPSRRTSTSPGVGPPRPSRTTLAEVPGARGSFGLSRSFGIRDRSWSGTCVPDRLRSATADVHSSDYVLGGRSKCPRGDQRGHCRRFEVQARVLEAPLDRHQRRGTSHA